MNNKELLLLYYHRWKPATQFFYLLIKQILRIWLVGKGNFCHNREKKATTSAENNINNGDNDALALAVYNAVKVQVPLPPIFLPIVMTYVGETPATIVSTFPVANILEGQT